MKGRVMLALAAIAWLALYGLLQILIDLYKHFGA